MQVLDQPDQHVGLTAEQRRWRLRIFVVTWLAYAGFYLCRKNLSVLMPYLHDSFGYDKKDLAIAITGYNLFYMLGQFGNGPVADRFGPRLIVGVGLIVAAFSNFAMGFAASIAAFTVLNIINGYSQATGWPGLVKSMSAWTRLEERGVTMAWWSTNYVVGGFIGTILATWFAANSWLLPQFTWQRGFWGPAILLASIGIIFILFSRDKPADVGLPEVDKSEPSTQQHAEELPDTISPLKEALTQPAVLVTGAMYFFVKMTRYSLIFWLPTYMVEHLHYSKDVSGYASSCYDFVGFAGVVAAGYFSDKIFQTRRFPVGAIMLIALGFAFLLQIKLVGSGVLANALGFSLIGFLTFGPDSLMTGAAAMDLGNKRGAATVAGVICGIGSIGQLLSSGVVAVVTARYGWDSLFYLFALFSFIGGALLLPLWNYRRRTSP